jgi:hypothetical protein
MIEEGTAEALAPPSKPRMRLIFLLVTALAVAAPASAQQPGTPADARGTSAGDAAGADLPVSLDRIREGLKKPPEQRLRNLDVRPDFTVQIEEQARIDEMMSKLDFRSGPAPAGGLYAYEQQRRLFNPTDRPLQQPYAAFSGGELITIALENLIARYLGSPLINAVSDAQRARAEAAARQEVDRAVAEYCAARADRDSIKLCTSMHER